MTELPRDEIFRCPNRQLAFALAICGAEWADQKDGGPAANVYSIGFLQQGRFKARFQKKFPNTSDPRASGFRSVQACAMDLHNAGIVGNVTYAFKRSRIVEEVIAAWDGMAKERTQAAADERTPETPEIPTVMIAQVLFVAANSTEDFNGIPFVNRMMQLASTMDGKSTSEPIPGKPGERTTVEGAGKVWSIFGSEKLRQHLCV